MKIAVVIAVIFAIIVVSKLSHHAHHGLTNAQIRAQVGRLADAQDGTNLTLAGVPWCVKGISDNEWECRINERNHATHSIWQSTVWAKCDATTCRLEQTLG